MGRTTGLNTRSGSNRLQFRRRWPSDVAHLLPGEGMARTTGSTDYEIARREHRKIEEEYDRAVDAARATLRASDRGPRGILRRAFVAEWPTPSSKPVLTSDFAAPLARAYFKHALRNLDLEPRASQAVDPAAFDRELVELEDRLARLCHRDDDIDHSYGATIWALEQGGVQSAYASEACRLLSNYLDRAMIQIATIRLSRHQGDYGDKINDSMFSATGNDLLLPDKPASNRDDAKGTSLDIALVDMWAKERAVSLKGVAKHRAAARWFLDKTGERTVEQITKKEVLAFKNAMIGGGVTAANANAKLSCLRTLLGYAVENDLLEANPAERVNVLDKDKDRRKRKEFDLPALHALFSSPVYAEDARPRQGKGEAAYWLPLIALYTGARLEEIAQLRPKDVHRVEYLDGNDVARSAWFIGITQEDALTTKNAASERRVPVHPELERLGFIRFASSALANEQKQLFSGLTRNIYGKLGAKWGEWWSGYRRDVCGIDDRRIVFHSFRHTFKYYARHVGIIDGVQRQIMGHSPGDTADEYGPSRFSLHQLVEGINQYRVPGLNLPPPPPPYRDTGAGAGDLA